jgi:hypothetical protein
MSRTSLAEINWRRLAHDQCRWPAVPTAPGEVSVIKGKWSLEEIN